MLFSSLVFIWYFLPIVFALYFIQKNHRIRNAVLLFSSIFFYAWGESRYVVLMIFSIIANYCFGLGVSAGRRQWEKQIFLGLCILVNMGLLGYFKYFNLVADALNHMFELEGEQFITPRNIALPIGISFYTFQALSYVVDVYRGTITVQKNIASLALYVSFFPQLIAGPIVKYHDVCTQIRERVCTLDKIVYGIKRFSYGLAKKMLLANTFASVVDSIMAVRLEELGTMTIWFMAVLYAMQIYFDFSGYSDMAIGLGKMFGFDFMENFNYPYLSTSIKEFWRRWHISLSTWFKEYLYIPLGGNRKGVVRTCINLLIVFFATGLWHGAGANFIIWGLYYGVFLVLERGWLGKALENNRFMAVNHIYTMLIILVGWVLFRAETLEDALLLIRHMFVWKEGFYPIGMFSNNKVLFVTGCGILGSGILQTLFPKMKERIFSDSECRPADVAVMAFLMCLCTLCLVSNTYNPFIYFRF